MSQRSEKLHRQVEQLRAYVADLRKSQYTAERFYASMQATMSQAAAYRAAAERSKTREAQRAARAWKTNAILALLLAALTAGVALVITAKADDAPAVPAAAPIADDGHLPGDDVPAQEPPEAPENEQIEAALLARAIRLDHVTVTHYDICKRCCGKTDGITASGLRAVPHVSVAVDPAVIPLGADVLVDYGDGDIQYYRADDTGSGVRGNHIDLCVSSHDEALQLGRRTATVYWTDSQGGATK